MQKIVIVIEHFLPGFRLGGPVNSVNNFVEKLKSDYKIVIITRNYDFGLKKKKFPVNRKVINDNITLYYLSNFEFLFGKLLIINKESPDFLYMNSFFSLSTVSVLFSFLNLNKGKNRTTIIAPRGELEPEVLNLQKFKKEIFIYLLKIVIKYKNVIFHATNQNEELNIKQIFSLNKVILAENIPNSNYNLKYRNKEEKKLKIVFFSRIVPKKNLLFALETLVELKNIDGEIEFNVAGIIENKDYWNICLKKVDELSSKIKFNFLGEIEKVNVIGLLSNYHLFFFPTLSENFGHVIYESLSCGTPVLISRDRTPWRENDNGVFCANLNNKDEFFDIIKYFLYMNQKEFNVQSNKAYEFSNKPEEMNIKLEKYYYLFSKKLK
ncbi:MAG: glycosyltransferase [Cytophagaceae bacterium]|nr:glycosyltransferase [Cytophagaceae bacterium]